MNQQSYCILVMYIQEQGGDTAEIGEFFATCTITEARILLEHFLTKVISLVSRRYQSPVYSAE